MKLATQLNLNMQIIDVEEIDKFIYFIMLIDEHHLLSQVADFGLAKITSDVNTHVSTRVMGTFG